jgi:hypothetical protein
MINDGRRKYFECIIPPPPLKIIIIWLEAGNIRPGTKPGPANQKAPIEKLNKSVSYLIFLPVKKLIFSPDPR